MTIEFLITNPKDSNVYRITFYKHEIPSGLIN